MDLDALGLSCRWRLCRIVSCCMRDLISWAGMNLSLLRWARGVFTAGPLGKFLTWKL